MKYDLTFALPSCLASTQTTSTMFLSMTFPRRLRLTPHRRARNFYSIFFYSIVLEANSSIGESDRGH